MCVEETRQRIFEQPDPRHKKVPVSAVYRFVVKHWVLWPACDKMHNHPHVTAVTAGHPAP
jgi:hypothetical protein